MIKVHFSSIPDFRKRIVSLWQDQKEAEVYDFTFETPEVKMEFDNLVKAFGLSHKPD